MLPLKEYPIVDSNATLLDAVVRLDEARQKSDPARQPFMAVLVADRAGNIVGKLGHLAILQALEPRSSVVDDLYTLDQAGVSDSIMQTALDHYRTLKHDFADLCAGAAAVPVRSVMHPFHEHIDVEASINEVIHQMVVWQTLSILVTEHDRPIGLVRLADVCDEVIRQMRGCSPNPDIEA
jgi:hypothetical protein